MWVYKNKIVDNINKTPEDALGFIYIIYNETKDKYYIGRKEFRSFTNPEVSKAIYDKCRLEDPKSVTKTKHQKASKKEGKIVWRYKRRVIKETNWLKYKGSSSTLKEDIKRGDKISKEILHYCYSKSELTYLETKEILCSGCFQDDKCYNEWISAKIRKEFVYGKKD